jgi:hypothetical protein
MTPIAEKRPCYGPSPLAETTCPVAAQIYLMYLGSISSSASCSAYILRRTFPQQQCYSNAEAADYLAECRVCTQ